MLEYALPKYFPNSHTSASEMCMSASFIAALHFFLDIPETVPKLEISNSSHLPHLRDW